MRVDNPKSLVRTRVSDGLPLLGMMVSCGDPAVTDMLGASGYDFVIIDNEHGPLGLEATQHHVRAAEAFSMIPMIRVGENSPNLIGKFLDVGCQGVIVPHVDTSADAERAVAATRFAPRGVRGMCPASHAAGYRGGDTSPFTRNAERETLVGVIIESPKGVEAAEEIAAVDGVDIVLFGPGDLSHELGVVAEGWRSPLVTAAWERVVAATKDAGKLLMAMTLAGDTTADIVASAEALYAEGADLVALYVDLLLFQRLIQDLAQAKRTQRVATSVTSASR